MTLLHHRFLKDIALADLAFEAEGATYDELFQHAAEAVFAALCRTSTEEKKTQRTIDLTAPSVENLLYDFLSDIVYLKDADGLVFSAADVSVRGGARWSLHAVISGEHINRDKHALGSDVKAVTMHMLKVWQEKKQYCARVILDI
mgnify:CR=1 FL=1